MRYVLPLVLALTLLTLLAVASAAHAGKPGGCEEQPPHPSCKNEDPTPTPTPAPDITAHNFHFHPQNLPDTSVPADGIVAWFNEQGRHDISICAEGVGVIDGVCAEGDVLANSPGAFKEGETVIFDFDVFSSGTTVNYFCRFHVNKGMVGMVTVP